MSEIFTINHLPSRTIVHDGREYLFFSGTAYLGLPQNAQFQQLMLEGAARYGTAFGSSRNGNLRLSIYEEAEARLAATVGAEMALTLSSGMMAGQVVSNWLRSQNYSFLYAPNTHPALWHDATVDLPSLSFADWTAQLPAQLEKRSPGPVAILMNSLDAVCSSYYDFSWIDSLPDNRSITLVIDDSHGLGILNEGRGVWPKLQQKPMIQLLVTASLAKAMGLPGGVVFGDGNTLRTLRQTAFFGACSPMQPACLDAYVRAGNLYEEGRERLRQNVLLAEQLLLPTGLFYHAKGYPVFFTEHDGLYSFLLQNETFIYSFAYPTASDRANTRIVISAFHEAEDIEKLAEWVNKFKRKGRRG